MARPGAEPRETLLPSHLTFFPCFFFFFLFSQSAYSVLLSYREAGSVITSDNEPAVETRSRRPLREQMGPECGTSGRNTRNARNGPTPHPGLRRAPQITHHRHVLASYARRFHTALCYCVHECSRRENTKPEQGNKA